MSDAAVAEQTARRIDMARELPRYVVVCGAALALDMALLLLFHELFGLHYLLANVLAFSIASVAAYIGSIYWVFRRRRLTNRRHEFLLFIAIGIGGLGINQGALWTGVEMAALGLPAAKLGAAGASFIFNFLARKLALFR